jgi:GNAT superfamily N-acetyltransferase
VDGHRAIHYNDPMRKLLKLAQRFFGLSVFRLLERPLEHRPMAAEGVRFTELGEVDLLKHCADPALELPGASARGALARGDRCVGALEGGRLLGYAWFAFAPTPESGGMWIDFDADAAYSYRHFVRPECRGRRIAGRLLPAADALCAAQGRGRCLILIHEHNAASIRASERSGARTVGHAVCLTLFGRLLCWRSPGTKRHGLRFFRPQANLRPLSAAMRRLASILAATDPRN